LKFHVLVAVGQSVELAQHGVVSIEKLAVCTALDCPSLQTGMAVMFALYLVLNLKYQPEADAFM
jgi:hypothetical protein